MIKVIGVIGSGAMGTGIAQVIATAGLEVYIYDSNPVAINVAKDNFKESLEKLVAKNKLTATEATAIESKITFQNNFKSLDACDLIIEAIIEDLQIKKQVFAELEKIVRKDCVLATNTSSLSIASIAAACQFPERVIGLHFFNPATIMPLVEIVPAIQTAADTILDASSFVNFIGKTAVVCKDTPGFIVNRIARPYYGEAIRIMEENIADIATIDWAMKEFGGFKMGPFELMDFIGHDVNYRVTEIVWSQFFYDNKFKPSIAQKRLFEANRFGRKSGIGFYDYREGATTLTPNKDQVLGEYIFRRIISLLINEAIDALYFQIASKEDIELAMLKGVNYPKGLLHWAEELGFGSILENLEELSFEYGDERYRPSVLLKQMVRENRRFFN
jgi:3-hydroxybutyryl-CoA dehydrogenase